MIWGENTNTTGTDCGAIWGKWGDYSGRIGSTGPNGYPWSYYGYSGTNKWCGLSGSQYSWYARSGNYWAWTGGVDSYNDPWSFYARSPNSYGGFGYYNGGDQIACYAENTNSGYWGYFGCPWWAGYFAGDVFIDGNLYKSGWVDFKIDHPLDPENKYLIHTCIESSEVLNVYSGKVILDDKGESWVEMEDWFEEINIDFRYQLTPIGAPGPNLYIAEEVHSNKFKIAGGSPGMKVSWQLTGVRNDGYAKANRVNAVQEKPDREKGYYIHPEYYGQSQDKRISNLYKPGGRKK